MVDGGAGDDLLVAGVEFRGADAGAADRFMCGDGADVVKFAFRPDALDADCEALDNTTGFPPDMLGQQLAVQPRSAPGHRLAWNVPCPPDERCRTSIRLAVRGADGRVPIAEGKRAGVGPIRVVVRLDRRARRLLRQAGGQALVVVAISDRAGYSYTTTLPG